MKKDPLSKTVMPFLCFFSNCLDQQICNKRMERGPGRLLGQRELRRGCQSAFVSWSGGEGQAQLWWNRGHQFNRGTQTGERTAADRPPEVQTGDCLVFFLFLFIQSSLLSWNWRIITELFLFIKMMLYTNDTVKWQWMVAVFPTS